MAYEGEIEDTMRSRLEGEDDHHFPESTSANAAPPAYSSNPTISSPSELPTLRKWLVNHQLDHLIPSLLPVGAKGRKLLKLPTLLTGFSVNPLALSLSSRT